MAEYIEREALVEHFRGRCVAKYPMSFAMGLFAAADEVSKIPAADVAPVVRCKDCVRCEEEHTTMGHVLFCYHWVRNTTEDGYCHEGVAKCRAKMTEE